MPPATPPHTADIVGRYVLCDEIAAGGMATVHLGRLRGSAGFARTVAIKRLHAQYAKDPDFVAMFLDEARLAGGIRHPNVVPTLDVLIHEGEILVVMEYVHGESLSRLARSQKAGREPQGQIAGVPLPIALTVVSGALYGLHAAHEARDDRGSPLEIVHRDVSPQNILVGADGVARVVDFGVAKAAGRLQMTREGTLKGKLAYMAPEQASSNEVDRRCDIYAASVVLWEALTGQRLFSGQNEMSLFRSVLAGAVTPPSALVPNLPPEVDALVMRGLAAEPDARFATALEMAEAAQRIAYATPGQVGAWVRALGGAALDDRAARVANIERSFAADAPALPSLGSGPAVRQSSLPTAPPVDETAVSTVSTRPTSHFHPAAGGQPPAPPPPARPPPALTVPLSALGNPAGVPQAPPGMTVPFPPGTAAPEVASQIITSLNIPPSHRRSNRATIVGVAVAPVVLVLIGTVIALWARSPEPPATPVVAWTSAASAAPVPMGDTPMPPVTMGDTPMPPVPMGNPVAQTPPAPSAEPSPPATTASSSTSTAAPVEDPSAKPAATARKPPPARGPKPGCNPPYTTDARGVRVPKMECL